MKYLSWLWQSSRGIRWNTVVRIMAGIGQISLGLLMVWLSRRFIDETIRTGAAEDVLRMVAWLVLTIVGGVMLRQVYYYMMTTASVRQSNVLRLRIFSSLFHRQLFTEKELHSGDVTSRLAKDIEQVATVTTDTLPQMVIAVPSDIARQYRELMQTDHYPPCHRAIPTIPKLTTHAWLSALQTERLERKTNDLLLRLHRCNDSWEQTWFVQLARSFGFGINSDALERLARRTPLRLLHKHSEC